MNKKVANPNRTKATLPSIQNNGRKIRLDELPLVAYATTCGHIARDYGVRKGDQIWCKSCASTKRVSRIIAQ